MIYRAGVLAFVVLSTGMLNASQVDLAAIVSGFHPQGLDALSIEATGDVKRQQCFAVLEGDQSNPSAILAVYTNNYTARVRVLSRSGSSFAVAAEPLDKFFAGWTCEVDAVDVNGDGRKEAHVKLYGNRGSSDWVFGWDGAHLANLTPTQPVRV